MDIVKTGIIITFHIAVITPHVFSSAIWNWNTTHIPKVVVELSIVCDKDYSVLFGYDERRISEYWYHQIVDLEVQFQTLSKSQISFQITNVMVMKKPEDLPFLPARNASRHTEKDNILVSFEKWAYENVQSDVILLVTGCAECQFQKIIADVATACRYNDDEKRYLSVGVLQSSILDWQTHKDLGMLMARILGANSTNYEDLYQNEMYFFGDAADIEIHKYLMSLVPCCLWRVDYPSQMTHLTYTSRLPLTIEEQCRIQFNSSTAFAKHTENNCKITSCNINQNNTINVLGTIFPIYNTPCEENKFCFRGQCLPKGVGIINAKNGKCLYSRDMFLTNDNMLLQNCPEYFFTKDEFTLIDHNSLGTYIAIHDIKTPEYKCLTVHKYTGIVGFVKCPRNQDADFGWDFIDLEDGSSEYLICHRTSNTCLESAYTDGVFSVKHILLTNKNARWAFHPKYGKAFREKGYIKNLQDIPNSSYPFAVVIKIAVVVDTKCDALYNGDKNALRTYLNSKMMHVNVKLRTLRNVFVQLRITSFHIFQENLMELDEKQDDLNIKNLNDIFEIWVFKHLLTLPGFDIALLVTVHNENFPGFVTSSKSLCEFEPSTKRYIGTMVVGLRSSKINDCDVFTRAFEITLAGKNKNGISNDIGCMLSQFKSTIKCGQQQYYFSECSEQMITEYINSDDASCLRQPNKLFHLAHGFEEIIIPMSTVTLTSLPKISVTTLLLTAFCIIIPILMVVLIKWKYKSHQTSQCVEGILLEDFYNGSIDEINPELNVVVQVEKLPFDRRWKFPSDQLEITRELGSGAFGVVCQGTAFGIEGNSKETTVAVKMAIHSHDNQLKALMSELKILSHLEGHVNIVNLLGECTKQVNSQTKLCVILEYCKHGDLRKFLLCHRNTFANEETKEWNLSPNDLLRWAFQIAKGMKYLSSRKILHGDLAARNCLLAEGKIIKICDFGLSKQLTRNYGYNYKMDVQNTMLPFKWVAIESFQCGLFSSKTDCWSYGVVLWEIFSLGDTPYPGYSCGREVFDFLKSGKRMEKPENASSEIYDLMLQCWNEDPTVRPIFEKIVEKFGNILGKDLCDHYEKINSDYQHFRSHKFPSGTSVLGQFRQDEVLLSNEPTVGQDGYLLAIPE